MKYYSLEGKIENKGEFGQIADFLLEEKKSKFISYVFNVSDEDEAKACVEKIRAANPGARHVVYIYNIYKNNISNIRFSDDGEPQGTGTKAIYELIDKEGITNLCIVIVRYFGGILLGAGPLSRAYLNAARGSLDTLSKKEIYTYLDIDFTVTYNGYNIFKNKIENFIQDEYVKIASCEFSENVDIKLQVVDFEIDNVRRIIEEINYGSR